MHKLSKKIQTQGFGGDIKGLAFPPPSLQVLLNSYPISEDVDPPLRMGVQLERKIESTDMEFVKNFTQPDFQAKNFTPQKRVNCDIFLANQQRKCIKY